MKTLVISDNLPYSPLIPAMELICKAQPGEKIELVMNHSQAFADLKEYLSEKNIGFREVYEEETMRLQFTINK